MLQVREVMDAYDRKYSSQGFRNNDWYYKWGLKLLSPRPGKTLLDIACGLGDLLYYGTQKHLQCFGIDLSPVAVRKARGRAPLARVCVGNGEHLPFQDNTFDNVSILGSLEHFLDPARGLLEVRRVLRWGGRAVILVPNSYYLPDIVWRVWRTGHGPHHKQIVERFATVQEWRAFIESGGLVVRCIKRYNFQWPRSRGDWAWYRANPRRLLGLLAAPFIPFNLSHSFVYLCEKDVGTRDRLYDPPAWPAPPRFTDVAQTRGNYQPSATVVL